MFNYESSKLLSTLSSVRHGFFLRPVSGTNSINKQMALTSLGIHDAKLFSLRQVHGNHVVVLDMLSKPDTVALLEADALLTVDYQLALSITYADCLPILLADSDASLVAAIHAGWRGLLNGVIANTITKIRQNFGSKNLLAAIGPAISVDGFFLAGDGLAAFLNRWPQHVKHRMNASHIDLTAVACSQLNACGVMQIEKVGSYTDQDSSKYFSYRRDQGQTGRHISIIALSR